MTTARFLCTLCAWLIASTSLFAQQPPPGTVRVRVLGPTNNQISTQDYPNGSDITVALGPVTAVRTVHIFSVNTLDQWGNDAPDGGIGKLTITGSADSSGRVNLLISDGDEVFPTLAAAAGSLTTGLTTFGGDSSALLPNNDPNTFADSANTFHDYDQNPWPTADVDATDWTAAGRLGLIIPDPSLRRQTVLAAVVSQDVCPDLVDTTTPRGRIEAGQVLRLHAVGSVQTGGTVLNGNINAHVIAVARDQYLTYGDIDFPPVPLLPGQTVAATTTGFRAIENVTAGNAIRGSVIARGRLGDDGFGNNGSPSSPNVQFYPREEAPEPTQFVERQKWLDKKWINRGSVFNVRIGPGTEADGFFGDIVSQYGRIYSVRSTGPISGYQIKAADGVLEVRIIDWIQGTDAARKALDKPLAVSVIQASDGSGDTGSVQKVGNFAGTPPLHEDADGYDATLAKARNQGAIHLIETKGEFSGRVRCTNLIDAGDNRPDLRDSLGRSGLIVWDGLEARNEFAPSSPSLDVLHLAHNVCVLAPSLHEINIGWQFKGSMVAFGSRRYADQSVALPILQRVVIPGSNTAISGGSFYSLHIGDKAGKEGGGGICRSRSGGVGGGPRPRHRLLTMSPSGSLRRHSLCPGFGGAGVVRGLSGGTEQLVVAGVRICGTLS